MIPSEYSYIINVYLSVEFEKFEKKEHQFISLRVKICREGLFRKHYKDLGTPVYLSFLIEIF